MGITPSDRVQRIKPSQTLAVTALAARLKAEGRNVIGLAAGEPDFDTPEQIKQAAIAAIEAGETKYTAVDGTPALKAAIIAKLKRDNRLDYTPQQILVSCGGKQSYFNLCQALLNPGDEVIIPAPYWVSYPDMVQLAGGQPIIIEAGQEQGFKISAAQLEAAISPRTRLVTLNSPSNPTGVVYSEAELIELGELLLRHPQLLVASDDMYEHIRWSSSPFTNIINARPELYERGIVLNGVSKAYAMTGWRIGYAAGPAELIKAMKTVQSQSTSNPSSISQAAASAAISGDQHCVGTMREQFQRRHDYVVAALNRIEGIDCLPAQGAFYLFPRMAGLMAHRGISDDAALATAILDEVGVALVPGSAFGLPGHQRLSYASSLEVLQDAMERLARFAKG